MNAVQRKSIDIRFGDVWEFPRVNNAKMHLFCGHFS